MIENDARHCDLAAAHGDEKLTPTPTSSIAVLEISCQVLPR
jgi:hypothetical protein